MTAPYYSLITNAGLVKHADAANNAVNLDLAELAVGDSNGTFYDPDGTETALQNELHRTTLTHVVIDENNPNQLIVEAVLEEVVGPFYIREVGIFDSTGDLFAIGKYPETFKPDLPDGSGKRLYIRMILGFASSPSVNLIINNDIALDPNFSTHVNEELNKRLKLTNRVTIVNNATDQDHDIDFLAGNLIFDDKSGQVNLESTLTKQIDLAWEAGNNKGGLFSGSLAPDTWYYCFGIYDPVNDIVDAGFSTDINAGDIPVGYTKKQRVGSILTNGSGNIIGFVQEGNYFNYKSSIQDINTNPATSRVFYNLSIPPIPCFANVSIHWASTSAATRVGWITSPLEADKVPSLVYPGHSSNSFNVKSRWDSYSISVSFFHHNILTNNSQIGIRSNGNAVRAICYTNGYSDLTL